MGVNFVFQRQGSTRMRSKPSLTLKESYTGTSLAVHWLSLHAPSVGDMGSIPDRETKIPTCHEVAGSLCEGVEDSKCLRRKESCLYLSVFLL